MAESEPGYKLTLKGDGITVEREVSMAVARDIIAMILAEDGAPQLAPHVLTAGTVMPQPRGPQQNHYSGPRKSLREYLNEVGARKNPQKILAIANYLNISQGKATFSIADLRPQFRLANEQLPANLNRDIQLASHYNWIAADHEDRKMFFVTKTGLDALANRFE